LRGNVLFRAARYEEADAAYTLSLREFRDMNEARGIALSRLGLAKSRSRSGQAHDATLTELAELEAEFERIGLRHARQAVIAFRAELPTSGTPVPERV
jgi:hypothetical protein